MIVPQYYREFRFQAGEINKCRDLLERRWGKVYKCYVPEGNETTLFT